MRSCPGDVEGEMSNTEEDAKLVRELAQVHWPIQYGTITVQIRDGKLTMVKVEKTIKAD